MRTKLRAEFTCYVLKWNYELVFKIINIVQTLAIDIAISIYDLRETPFIRVKIIIWQLLQFVKLNIENQ